MGWIYFFTWSSSFYGQIIENYRIKSVFGLSFDFEKHNFFWFLAYSIYTIWGYIDPNMADAVFQIDDIVFAVHAFIVTCINIIQIFIYYDENHRTQVVSSTWLAITSSLV